ncbi:MAG: DUF6323 family protein [Eubacteriales bacterium]|nr:DUF6323 family protein [Eubacteriales bacterium]
MENFLAFQAGQLAAAEQKTLACNELSERYGLRLTEAQAHMLALGREKALRDTGRVEFGPGVLPRLIYAFCDSPYLTRENYAQTLAELQDSFYYFKNESEERISDDELIDLMKEAFDGFGQGALESIATLDELCRAARNGEPMRANPWRRADEDGEL